MALGVFTALWVQQWAEGRSWQEKQRWAVDGLRADVADQYQSAVEWRVLEPCILSQIDQLQQRVLASGDRLSPAPVYQRPIVGGVVLLLPSRAYDDFAWQRATGDEVANRLDTGIRIAMDTPIRTACC